MQLKSFSFFHPPTAYSTLVAFMTMCYINSRLTPTLTSGVARSKTVGWTEGASRTHGERGARAYNGGLGAEPSADQSPLKLKAFCCWTRGKICHFSLVFLKLPSMPKIVVEMDRTCELLALESFSDYCK